MRESLFSCGLFCMLWALVMSSVLGKATGCAPSDLAALRSIAASFPGADFSDWEASDDCCAWGPSVICNTNASRAGAGRVTELQLDTEGRNMSNYPIPSSVCRLSSLTSLRLSGLIMVMENGGDVEVLKSPGPRHGLSGSIPPCIGANLTSLILLDLSLNSLTGPIPLSFSTLHSLHSLDLSSNSLSGPLPPFLCSGLMFPNLTFLDLSSNSFSGPVPTSFNTPLLQSLRLSSNSFSGHIPSLCGLASLTDLGLSSNAFSGELSLCRQRPRGSVNATQLTSLDVAHNQLLGPFPEWIGSLSNLNYLDLSYNSFNGSLPSSWQNLSRLITLDLSGNSLVAHDPGAPKLPSWFFTLSSLTTASLSSLKLEDADLHCSALLQMLNRSSQFYEILDISNNRFSSDVLICLSNHTTDSVLASLNISGNPLRINLGNLDTVQKLRLFELDLSSCELSGRLTDLFFNQVGSSISHLYLANNHLVGDVSAELGNLSQLTSLDLSNNYFTGFAPLVQKPSRLSELYLSSNNLKGDLSALLANIFNISACNPNHGTFLTNLDVSSNFLTGIIPPFLGQCLFPFYAEDSALKFNDNRLTGSIPDDLFNKNDTIYLQILSLSNNLFNGHIPPSFKKLQYLVLLDVSHNRLTGNLESSSLFRDASPGQYSLLRVLLLGYNGFTGSVPTALGEIAPALQLIDFSNNHLTGPLPVHSLQSLAAIRSRSSASSSRSLNVTEGKVFVDFKINIKGSEESYTYVVLALTVLDFSSNNLSGPISEGLGELSGLVSLNLSRNRLSGPIPPDLGKIAKQLQSLDLSSNELVGPIPASFGNLTSLEVFNVSHKFTTHVSLAQFLSINHNSKVPTAISEIETFAVNPLFAHAMKRTILHLCILVKVASSTTSHMDLEICFMNGSQFLAYV